ncbi:hypothetical protein HPB47_002593 [Ixodes persulcatus]|uniref:Uncharacterized protein n=1 Tax=Ixodes persulcatus TaxID=34615 RepID=A0AC60PLS1_IXOPE|nr:hypothetical protein HPB47_002593 [Ixodes persulcatus]
MKLNDEPRGAVLLQEVGDKSIGLTGYRGFHSPSIVHVRGGVPKIRAQAAVFLKKSYPHQQLDTSMWCTETQEVVAVRTTTGLKKIILLSAYYRPTNADDDNSWMSQMMRDFHGHHIVIGGDFNARHSDWGHDDETKKGQDIYEEYSSAGLTLLNDPRERTRVGQSERQQDSTPDLTITTNFTVAEWRWEEDTWCSDYYPITLGVKENGADKRKRESKTVIGNTFRLAVCTEYQIQDINEFAHALQEAT